MRVDRELIEMARSRHRVSHDRSRGQHIPSKPGMLTIGELAERTGTALRYYDELGLVTPAGRASGHRRYDEDAVNQVGVVLLLRDIGFTLEEIGTLVRGASWRKLAKTKLSELKEQAADIAVAVSAIEHSLACPAPALFACQSFWAIVEERVSPDRDRHGTRS
jgi:DNA-binding transcriptional MerR regulator